ncbi:hypothetical protein [Thermoactinospora rubra]|uniref:hypothetical protein n=1 Tax=Thermoactinospora rubra TaxID=1088767 RepID=UPI000A10B0B7|nr:hypothetical protein [Thermoactinospora rubra]
MSALPSWWEGAEKRVPESLDDLHGPAEGVVDLPIEVAWSGLTSFDVSDPRLRLSMYHLVIAVGRRVDVERFLCAEHVRNDWPLLRRLIPRPLCRIWEERFPTLVQS